MKTHTVLKTLTKLPRIPIKTLIKSNINTNKPHENTNKITDKNTLKNNKAVKKIPRKKLTNTHLETRIGHNKNIINIYKRY